MNWAISIPTGPASLFVGRARAAFEAAFTVTEPGGKDENGNPTSVRVFREPAREVREQFEASLAAAQYALRSVQPKQDGPVAGSLRGVASPGHVGEPGSNDSIGVSVYVPDNW